MISLNFLSASVLILFVQILIQTKDANCYTTIMSLACRSSFVSSPVSCMTPIGTPSHSNQKRSFLEMKKGKSKLPVEMRGNEKKMQQAASMREQMIASSTPGSDGMPVFNLYVRSKRANVWYPAGSFKGDEKSAALAKSYSEDSFMAGMSKNQLDSGVAGSLYQDLKKLVESIVRTYPQLRKSRDELEFGYKLAYPGLSDDKTKINLVKPEERKGLFDNFKAMFGN